MEISQPGNLRNTAELPTLTKAQVAIELLQIRQAAEATADPKLKTHLEAIVMDYRRFYPEATEQ